MPRSILSSKYIYDRVALLAVDPATCEHEWLVVASISNTVELQVQCNYCATYSSIPDPTEDEWNASFNAMENPYFWDDHSRIKYYFVDDTVH